MFCSVKIYRQFQSEIVRVPCTNTILKTESRTFCSLKISKIFQYFLLLLSLIIRNLFIYYTLHERHCKENLFQSWHQKHQNNVSNIFQSVWLTLKYFKTICFWMATAANIFESWSGEYRFLLSVVGKTNIKKIKHKRENNKHDDISVTWVLRWSLWLQLATTYMVIKPYFSNFPFLYPLKTSENQRFLDAFSEYRNTTLI